jgi:hypothetical protein
MMVVGKQFWGMMFQSFIIILPMAGERVIGMQA